MFDELVSGSVFGTAAVILNSDQYVTTVASTACELWYIPKDKFLYKLQPWPLVKNRLAQEACSFLERVRTCYKKYNHANCPTLKEMLKHADQTDLQIE
jgi:CRP-like cAMP-binding protein